MFCKMNCLIPASIALSLSVSTTAAASESPFQGLVEKLAEARFCYQATNTSPMTEEQVGQLALSLARRGAVSLRRLADSDRSTALFQNEADASAVLRIDMTNRSFQFHRGFAGMSGESSTPNLPSAAVGADHALAILKTLELAPADTSEMVVERVGGLNMGVHREDGSTEEFAKIVTVRFGRMLDGLRVEGPGSRIIVHMGESSGLVGITHRWQNLTSVPIAAADRFSTDEVHALALEFLRQGAAQAADGKVETVDVVLFDDGRGIIEPAVRVVADLALESTRINEEGRSVVETLHNPFDYYVPVMRNPKARFPFYADLELAAKPEQEVK